MNLYDLEDIQGLDEKSPVKYEFEVTQLLPEYVEFDKAHLAVDTDNNLFYGIYKDDDNNFILEILNLYDKSVLYSSILDIQEALQFEHTISVMGFNNYVAVYFARRYDNDYAIEHELPYLEDVEVMNEDEVNYQSYFHLYCLIGNELKELDSSDNLEKDNFHTYTENCILHRNPFVKSPAFEQYRAFSYGKNLYLLNDNDFKKYVIHNVFAFTHTPYMLIVAGEMGIQQYNFINKSYYRIVGNSNIYSNQNYKFLHYAGHFHVQCVYSMRTLLDTQNFDVTVTAEGINTKDSSSVGFAFTYTNYISLDPNGLYLKKYFYLYDSNLNIIDTGVDTLTDNYYVKINDHPYDVTYEPVTRLYQYPAKVNAMRMLTEYYLRPRNDGTLPLGARRARDDFYATQENLEK